MLNTRVVPFERGSENKIYSSLNTIKSPFFTEIAYTSDKYLTHIAPTSGDKILISALCVEHVLCVLYTGINACRALDLSTLGLSTTLCATVFTPVILYPLYELWAYDTKQANIKREISNAIRKLLPDELIDTLQQDIGKLVNLGRVEGQLMKQIEAHFELLKTKFTDLGTRLNDCIRNVSSEPFDAFSFAMLALYYMPYPDFPLPSFFDRSTPPTFHTIGSLPLYNLTTALNHLRLEGGRIIMPLLCLSACVQILGYVAIHYATISVEERFVGVCACLAIFCWYKGIKGMDGYQGAERRLFSPLPLQAVEEAITVEITERGKGMLFELDRAQSRFYRMIAKLEESKGRYYD